MIILDRKADFVNPAALQRFARRAQTMTRVKGEVAVLITSRRKVQALNRRFRNKEKATDVLSFPSRQGGDIAICFEIARQNAARLGHSVIDEIKVLVLHGMLHLAGYDHETDSGQMARAEARMRARLKLPASLIQRSQHAAAAVPSRERSAVAGKKTLLRPGRKTP
ncbi:MAG TPA: rRNA maturation RNase YbeY [Verrucomicrobiae bacterium]|nr:rRNA maturation RNase YbeY [Verrucomicrobiae bacterium]